MSSRRTSYNRRRTTLANPQVIGNPVLELTGYSGNTVEFTWTTPQPRLSIFGILQMQNITTLATPIAMPVATETVVVVEYADTPAAEDVFFLGQNDPAIRTYWGGYVSAGFFKTSAGPAPPAPIEWTASREDANNAILTLTAPPTEWGMVNPDERVAISNQTTAETSTDWQFAGPGQIRIAFPFYGVEAGQTLEVTNGAAAIIDAMGRYLENTSHEMS